MKYSKTGILVTLKNKTNKTIHEIPANSNKMVFFNHAYLKSIPFSDLMNGSLIGYDILGNEISSELLMNIISNIIKESYSIIESSPLSTSIEDYYGKSLWNLEVSKYAISTVRADVIYSDIKTDTVANILNVLKPSIEYIQLGMFAEASSELRGTTPTVFLTRAKLDMYADMISSADALKWYEFP